MLDYGDTVKIMSYEVSVRTDTQNQKAMLRTLLQVGTQNK
jgi:hypothetical protein